MKKTRVGRNLDAACERRHEARGFSVAAAAKRPGEYHPGEASVTSRESPVLQFSPQTLRQQSLHSASGLLLLLNTNLLFWPTQEFPTWKIWDLRPELSGISSSKDVNVRQENLTRSSQKQWFRVMVYVLESCSATQHCVPVRTAAFPLVHRTSGL